MEWNAIAVTVKKSEILHLDAGRWVITARPVDQLRIMGYCYSSLVLDDLSFGAFRFKTYGEGIMEMTKKKFLNWTNRLPGGDKGQKRGAASCGDNSGFIPCDELHERR